MEVAELWSSLGARVNEGQWKAADARIAGARRSVDGLDRAFSGAFQDRAGHWRSANGRLLTMRERAAHAAQGIDGVGRAADRAGRMAAGRGGAGGGAGGGGGLGGIVNMLGGVKMLAFAGVAWLGTKLVGAGLKFNMTAEESRNQIAGMLALSKNTAVADQYNAADSALENLRVRAAALPGTTAEYISMLGNIVQPVSAAGMGMADLEDMTVGAVVAAKALGEEAGAAARDVGQALRGQAGADDPFIGKLLDTAGFAGQAGRQKFNAKSAAERAKIVKQLLTSPQLQQMAEAQGKSMSGRLSTLEDTWGQFVGKVLKPLFEALGPLLEEVNAWISTHEKEIAEAAAVIGEVMLTMFRGLMWAFGFLGAQAQRLGRVAVFVKDVFASLWRVVRDGGSSLWAGMTGIAERVRDAFVAVFGFLAKLPVIREILDGMAWAKSKSDAVGGAASKVGSAVGISSDKSAIENIGSVISFPARAVWKGMSGLAGKIGDAISPGPSAMALPATSSGAPGATTINVGGVGDINVTAPAGTDTQAVAQLVRSSIGDAIDERLGDHFRRAMDTVA